MSCINRDKGGRPTPNPNVLIELGYAARALGWDRVILVLNEAFGPVEELPFDLRVKRTVRYRLAPGDAKAEVRGEVSKRLEAAIRAILATTQKAGVSANTEDAKRDQAGDAAEAKAKRIEAQALAINVEAARIRALSYADTTHRANVLANLDDGQYKRQKDIDTDLDDLARREEVQRAAETADADLAT